MTPPLSVVMGGQDAIQRWVAEQRQREADTYFAPMQETARRNAEEAARRAALAATAPPAANVLPATGIVPAVPGVAGPAILLPPVAFDFGPDEWFQMSAEADSITNGQKEKITIPRADSRDATDVGSQGKGKVKKRRKKAVKKTGKKRRKKASRKGGVEAVFID